MTIFKMYDCDFGVTIRGSEYFFEHVDEVAIEDPERTRLTRGANAGNKLGIDYKEGLKDAKTITLTVIGLPAELHALLKDVYTKRERCDLNVVSRADGSSKIAKAAILSQSPKQLTMADGADSFNTQLIFESYDVEETHKT